MPTGNLVFCAASLLLSLALAFVLYPQARLSETQLDNIATPKSMEEIEQVIDLGDEYGPVTAIELMGYYLDNPPQPSAGGQAEKAPKRQFGGC
jgi:hypothetical protein